MCIVVVVLCVLLSSYVYLLYCVCIAVFTLDAGLLATSQYSAGPAIRNDPQPDVKRTLAVWLKDSASFGAEQLWQRDSKAHTQ